MLLTDAGLISVFGSGTLPSASGFDNSSLASRLDWRLVGGRYFCKVVGELQCVFGLHDEQIITVADNSSQWQKK